MSGMPKPPKAGGFKSRDGLQRVQRAHGGAGNVTDLKEWVEGLREYEDDFIKYVEQHDLRFDDMKKFGISKPTGACTNDHVAQYLYQV